MCLYYNITYDILYFGDNPVTFSKTLYIVGCSLKVEYSKFLISEGWRLEFIIK